MSQGNKFHQVGYDHYLKAPPKPPSQGRKRRKTNGFFPAFKDKMQNPAVAFSTLLITAAFFIAIVAFTYPFEGASDQQIPIVRADLTPIKVAPNDVGGMAIPNRDSTILARDELPIMERDTRAVENLLAETPSGFTTKERAIQDASPSALPTMIGEQPTNAPDIAPQSGQESPSSIASQQQEMQPPPTQLSSNTGIQNTQISNSQMSNSLNTEQPRQEQVSTPSLPAVTQGNTARISGEQQAANAQRNAEIALSVPVPEGFDLKAPDPKNILQKIGATQTSDENASGDSFALAAAQAAQREKPAKPLHAAATAPQTIDYVRNVLEEKSQQSNTRNASQQDQTPNTISKSSAITVETIEPAAGVSIAAGSYYVQLASITDRRRAQPEFAKMQNTYAVLRPTALNVEEANLDRGTFYRLKAGPMSEESANAVCSALKNANKPGGCLVVR